MKSSKKKSRPGAPGNFWVVPYPDGLETVIVRQSLELAAKVCFEFHKHELHLSFSLGQYPYFWELSPSGETLFSCELCPPDSSIRPYSIRSTPWAEVLAKGCTCGCCVPADGRHFN